MASSSAVGAGGQEGRLAEALERDEVRTPDVVHTDDMEERHEVVAEEAVSDEQRAEVLEKTLPVNDGPYPWSRLAAEQKAAARERAAVEAAAEAEVAAVEEQAVRTVVFETDSVEYFETFKVRVSGRMLNTRLSEYVPSG